MKIECVTNKLLESIQKCEKITGKNLTLPILSCISFETGNSLVKIKATNLDIGIELSLSVKVITPGSVAIPGSVLLQFLTNLQHSEKITVESVDGNILLTTDKTSTIIKTQPVDDFPIIPMLSDGKSIVINPEAFTSGLKAVWYSSALSSMKPELSSVYIYHDGEESLIFVATDSFRLAEKKVRAKKTKDFGSVLIPFKNVTEIIRILDGVKEEVEITFNENQIAFSWGSSYLVSRIINGTFPDYKQIIPKEAKTEVVVLKQDLIQALKLANVFSDNFNQLVMKISPSKKEFEITTRNNDIGENHNKLEAVLKGEDLSISFNYKYIADSFQSLTSDSLTLEFQGTGRPLVVHGVSDPTFMYLVMPMNK